MNTATHSRTNPARRRTVLFGAIAFAIMLGAMAAWLAPHPAVASASATLTTGNEADRRPGPPGKRGDDPDPSPSASPSASASPSPAPSASPSSAPAASPAPSAAPSSAGWSPTGIAPTGWQAYRGNARVPFSMYYPGGWTVDESHAQEGRVYFYAPGVTAPTPDATWVMLATTGVRDKSATIEALRDQYYQEQIAGKHAQSGIEVSRKNSFSGMTFASLGAGYGDGGSRGYAYFGAGLKNQVPWYFHLNSPYGNYDQDVAAYFTPMMNSLNIYGNP